ncbi:MAG: flagellar protein FlgN [Planctomycetota bacterium]
MDKPWETLETALMETLRAGEDLRDLLRWKKEAIVKLEREDLERIFPKEDVLVGRMRRAEDGLARAIAGAARVAGLPAKGARVADLLPAAPEDRRKTLTALREDLLGLGREIAHLNQLNASLVRHFLGHVNSFLKTLTGGGEAGVYAMGRKSAAGAAKLLDRTA